ncbi:hypothetical protein Huta_2482 [Halorhabdus utahensis DSM 12940]|uniref:DUF8121 domain-containing protein n=1 Tax=Halorhabdus utahensis (strain DSM 12940 / JCM 11049 / AX-2) TaxID=519442 RepID=C7NMU8_HALUD|nr:hypothetical protein [Halorhabdus utahensis]ACV12646.1 hypothetical protein Huta_2482 [Halorhabdus utahensis DSM 12940]
MRRRRFLAAAGVAAAGASAGCGALRSKTTLSEPSRHSDAQGVASIHFSEDGEEVGHFGVNGGVADGVVPMSTEIWHREGTTVESVRLRVWMPDAETPADVAVVSPVEGDSSPPPEVRLYSPDRRPGTVIELSDLDDLADETISTLECIVRPWSETATTVAFDVTMALAGGGMLGTDYELDGELRLEYPALAE